MRIIAVTGEVYYLKLKLIRYLRLPSTSSDTLWVKFLVFLHDAKVYTSIYHFADPMHDALYACN